MNGSNRRLALAVCCVVGIGQPLWADPLGASVQPCLERFKEAGPEARLLCLRKLEAATPALCDLLAKSDGATDHLLVASILDGFRSLGSRAARTLAGWIALRQGRRARPTTGQPAPPVPPASRRALPLSTASP